MMEIFGVLIIFYAILLGAEARSVLGHNYRGTWKPDNGETREEWLRCHGFRCKTWDDTRRKLEEFKAILAKANNKTDMVDSGSDDSLDGCIWLTGDQLDQTMAEIRNRSRARNAINRIQIVDGSRRHRNRNKHNRHKKTGHHGIHKRKVTNFRKYPITKWTTKTIHWKFDGQHSEEEREIIRGAFSHWQQQTCLTFNELGTIEPYTDNHILVTRQATGCHSFVGRITTIPQQLNLQRACLYNLGTPVHEIGHALGLWHEQQRSDRDSAIRVLWENLGYYVGQFYKGDTNNLTPYDYGSVMHYGPKDGSINAENTMETLNPWYHHNLGQRTGLSFLDAKAINMAYCQDACSDPLVRCQHGGYQDPNNCSRCKCPDGLGGVFCDQVAPPENAVCGGDMTLLSMPLYIESPGYKQGGPYPNHITCSWIVKVLQGSRISLKFEGEFAVYAYYQEQCHHWVEVKYKQDIGAEGPRFCGNRLPNDTIISEGEEMLIIFKSNWTDDGLYSRIGFRAKLEKVDPGDGTATTSAASSTTTTTTTPTRRTTTVTTPTTTTTTSTTRATTTTTSSNDCQVVDVVLVIDSSDNVIRNNWYKIILFVNSIISQFNVALPAVHVGVIIYATHADIVLPLDGYDSISDVTKVVDAIRFLGGATNTDSGLSVMRSQFSSLGRLNAAKIAILITDGKSSEPKLAIEQASLAKSEGIRLYVAGLGENFDYSEAANLVGDHKHIIQIGAFEELDSPIFNYGDTVHEVVCFGGVTQTTSDLSWSCDFEDEAHPFCQMIQDRTLDQFDWIHQSGRTPSESTGPTEAYNGRYYAYIEASDPRKPGDEAILYLPKFNAEGKHCLSFAYSMFGFHIRTLQIAIKTRSGSIMPVWLLTGEQDEHWQTADVSINLQKDDQITIIGKRGDAYSGDIAIDDIHIRGGQC